MRGLYDWTHVAAEVQASIREAEEIVKRLNRGPAFREWVTIGKGLFDWQQTALQMAGTEDTATPEYRTAWKSAMPLYPTLAAVMDDESERSLAIWLFKNREDLEKWHTGLSDKERRKWNHPRSIQRHSPLGQAETAARKARRNGAAATPARSNPIRAMASLFPEERTAMPRQHVDVLEILGEVEEGVAGYAEKTGQSIGDARAELQAKALVQAEEQRVQWEAGLGPSWWPSTKAIPARRKNRLRELVFELKSCSEQVRAAIVAGNNAIEKYNTTAAALKEFAAELTEAADQYVAARTEKWQESAAAESYAEWAESLSAAAEDIPDEIDELDEPELFDADDWSGRI